MSNNSYYNDQWRIINEPNQNKVSNYSMDFDATSDSININSLASTLGSKGSFSAWVNVADWSSRAAILGFAFDSDNFLRLGLRPNNNNCFTIGGQFNNVSNEMLSDTTSLSENVWYHVVATSNGSVYKLYVNGQLQTLTILGGSNNGDWASDFSSTANKGSIGSLNRTGPSEDLFNGKIDQVSIFDYELSQDQVTQLGAEGYAFNFNGSNNYVDTSNITSLNSQSAFSTSFWTNPQGTLTNVPVVLAGGISSTNRFYIQLLNSTTIRYVSSGSSGNIVDVTVPLILDGNWHHIATAHSGTSLDVYFDGVKINSSPLTITAVSANIGDNFTIGAYFTRASNFFNGELSNTTVFNTGLTSPQVQTLYNNGKPLADMSSFTSLQGWWKLDDTATFNSGTNVWSIPDDSSNSNTGTSVGMNASNLVASNINGELIANPMITTPKPIAYYQLGDQSVDNGANLLVPNNSLSDFVFSFDGSNDFIDAGSASYLNGLSQFSISVWINLPTAADSKYIVSDWNYNTSPFGHFVLGTRIVSGSYYGLNLFIKQPSDVGQNSAQIGTLLLENTWHNAIFSYNSGTVTCYLNGSPVAVTVNGTLPTTLTSQDGNLNIGKFGGTATGFFPGKLSNIALWSVALTQANATKIYNNGSPNDISSLSPTAWYKLNAADTFNGSTSTWTINDYGSGGNDGTSVGMDSSNLVVSTLQQTNGFSPYALSLDGVDDHLNCGNDSSLQITGAMTISYWLKGTSTHGAAGVGTLIDANNPGYFLGPSTALTISFGVGLTSSSAFFIPTTQQITTTDWHHIVGVYTPSVSMKIYIDGQLSKTETSNIPSSQYAGGNDFKIGYRPCCKIDGQISNVAIWNTDLSSSEITEIYNQGRPSDLNTFSGTAPVSWWQIGSNSSYNSSASTWTCLDEIGTNNAVSAGSMTNDDIVDGPGYSASGLGTSSIDIKGDAPYSTANGLSENMDVLDRTTDVPS